VLDGAQAAEHGHNPRPIAALGAAGTLPSGVQSPSLKRSNGEEPAQP
jgi:hypothetical protein